MEIIKKISVKTVCGLPRKLLGNLDRVPLMQVLGEVTDLETGKGDYDDAETGEKKMWTALLGQFKAQNIATKQTFFSGRCFLPDVMGDLIIAQFKCSTIKPLQFGCIIGVKDAPDVIVGYEYYATSLIPMTEENDPFRAIENKIAGTDLSLEHYIQKGMEAEKAEKEKKKVDGGAGKVQDPNDIPWQD